MAPGAQDTDPPPAPNPTWPQLLASPELGREERQETGEMKAPEGRGLFPHLMMPLKGASLLYSLAYPRCLQQGTYTQGCVVPAELEK